jgi:hypothetical protein
LRCGMPLGEALAAAFSDSRVREQRRAAFVREMFSTWAELGWVCAPELESLIKA